MNTMDSIVWMFPIIFMLHDFEEIIMAEVWNNRYKKLIDTTWPNHKPFALNYVNKCKTATFSIGVEIIFLIFSLISLFSILFKSYFIWYSAFLGITLHFLFIHTVLCIRFKHYVPGIITSVLFFFPSSWLLFKAVTILHYNMIIILLACLTAIALITLLLPLHKLMGPLSRLLSKYSQTKKIS